MLLKIISSLVIASLSGFLAGGLCILVTICILSETHPDENANLFSMFFLVILNGIISFLLGLGFLIPVSIFYKKGSSDKSFRENIDLYLPFVSIPLGILFCVILLVNFDDHFADIFLLTLSVSTFCSAYTSLWVLIKKLQSNQDGFNQ